MALFGPLLFGGCDASKPELEATKTKLAAITLERDGLKAQLDAAQAILGITKKERDDALAKLAAAAAEAAAKNVPDAAPPAPVAPAKPAAPASTAGKKPVLTGAKNALLSKALLDKGAAVQQCAIEHAMDKGAKKVVVSVRVTINNTGKVVDSRVTANVTDGPDSEVKACVESLVRTARFPPIPTPMATDERSWTVAAD
jgi:hypothetical protein